MAYGLYPKNWKEITKYIRKRDNNTCQHCDCKDGELRTSKTGKVFKAVLAVARLDHDKENHEVSMDRLLLLCQPCHLKNDRDNNTAIRSKNTNPRKSKKQEILDLKWYKWAYEERCKNHEETYNHLIYEIKCNKAIVMESKRLSHSNDLLLNELKHLKISKSISGNTITISLDDTSETLLEKVKLYGLKHKYKVREALFNVVVCMKYDRWIGK